MKNNNCATATPKAVVTRVPPAFLRAMAALLGREGIDFAAECRHRGLDVGVYLDNSLGIPRPLHENFERCIAELTRQRPDQWLELGLALRLPAYGILGLATMTAPTVKDILTLVGQFRGLPFSLAGLDPIAIGDEDGVRWDWRSVPAECRDFTLVRDIAANMVAMNDVWAGTFPFTRIVLTPAQADLAPTLAKLGIPLETDGAETCVLWQASHSTQPLPYGERDLHLFYVEQCRQLAAHSAFNDPFLDRVSRAIENTLYTQPQAVSLEHTARLLTISVRTLQRRLGDRDMSFREISDRTRQKMAEGFLQDPTIAVADVAFRLGYSEPAGFYHAFHRWLGVSPNEYRREAVGRSALAAEH